MSNLLITIWIQGNFTTLLQVFFHGNLTLQPQSSVGGLEEGELLSSSCQLVCEWAQKLLNQSFGGIRELAEHLVSSNYVNSRSMAAFTLLAAGRKNVPVTTAPTGGKKQPQIPHTTGNRKLLVLL